VKKKPRFFCDNCGAEVDRDVKACPHCGRFFASVRCPSCGFVGEEKTFAAGCPSCGYSAPSSKAAPGAAKKPSPAPLPLWVYIFSVLALLCVLAVLLFVVMK
jgi:predicted RNA-binding Zn-ribbon protein involved in translation (DUF1610 family)